MRDATPVLAGHMTIEDFAEGIGVGDLQGITDDVYGYLEDVVSGAGDAEVAFIPADPAAADGSETGWRLTHVICHVTAGLEESAALASSLARGVEVTGRSRFETPWSANRTPEHLRQRVAESRRMTNAFLQTWPDRPDLAITDTPVPRFGPLNAIHRHLLGVIHADSHRAQCADILAQVAASAAVRP